MARLFAALLLLAGPSTAVGHAPTTALLPSSWYRANGLHGMKWHEPRATVVSAACGDPGYARAAKELGERLDNTSSKAVSLVIFYSTDADLALLKAEGPSNGTNVAVRFVQADAAALDPNLGWQEATRFKCCNLKLHLPALLPSVDGVAIWVDLDTRIFGDVHDLHRWFRREQKHLKQARLKPWAALSWESADSYAANWYHLSRDRRSLEYFEPNGLNSGVLVADLTQWRAADPQLSIQGSYDMPDQDALNVYFQSHRDEMVQLPFAWNWRGANISGGVPAEEALIEHFAGCGISRDAASCPDHERRSRTREREAPGATARLALPGAWDGPMRGLGSALGPPSMALNPNVSVLLAPPRTRPVVQNATQELDDADAPSASGCLTGRSCAPATLGTVLVVFLLALAAGLALCGCYYRSRAAAETDEASSLANGKPEHRCDPGACIFACIGLCVRDEPKGKK